MIAMFGQAQNGRTVVSGSIDREMHSARALYLLYNLKAVGYLDGAAQMVECGLRI
jgi:hypothetical protein